MLINLNQLIRMNHDLLLVIESQATGMLLVMKGRWNLILLYLVYCLNLENTLRPNKI